MIQQSDFPHIFVDGATGDSVHAGVAAIARSADGQFLGWGSRQLPAMTNNEAEYHALLLGMELAVRLALHDIVIVSDSEVVVWQMRGRSRVVSSRLRTLHREACAQARHFRHIAFRHVLRGANEVADALATEALLGRAIALPAPRGSLQRLVARFGWAAGSGKRSETNKAE